MKRHALLAATLLTVALTAGLFLTAQASPCASRLPRHRDSSKLLKSRDSSLEQAARRCFHGEPRHWRDCLLQR
jgi:hypothetical protein